MKYILPTLIALVCLVNAQERTWKSSDGKALVGELVEDKGDSVILKVKTREFTIPLARLSQEDNQWIEEYRKLMEEKKKEDSLLAGKKKKFPTTENQKVSFHVYYPKAYASTKRLPMIILFSAHGSGEEILSKFKASCEEVGWIGVGCDTFRNKMNDSEGDPLFAELLPIIEKNVVHDPQRLFMGGMSGGAMRAFGYTVKFERPWKGIISCGGWLGKQYDVNYTSGMRVAWVNGDKDKAANSWVDKDSDFLKSKFNCKTKLFTFAGGHVVGPPDVLSAAMRWADQDLSAD